MSRPWHSAKNKSLLSATTMALGKEIKELKNIYLRLYYGTRSWGPRVFSAVDRPRSARPYCGIYFCIIYFLIFQNKYFKIFFLQIWHPATGSTSGMNIQLDERMAGAL